MTVESKATSHDKAELRHLCEETGISVDALASEWFHSPNVLLGNQSPLDACKSKTGRQEVQRILARIATADFVA
jgi:hypothetical protein